MKIKVKGAPEPTRTIARQVQPRHEGFISRCFKIVVDDIRYKITGMRTEDRQKWEDYQRFCEMSRKGLK